jgi:hypothetical protein
VVGGTSSGAFALARYWGDTAPPVYAQASPDSIFVNATYEELLNRPVDQPGLAYWMADLSQGASREAVAQGIDTSPEHEGLVIDGFYQQYLGRHADQSGLAYWASAIGQGTTLEQVKAAILGSDEYLARAGSTTDGFLQSLYHDVLGRDIDAAGSAFWTAALAEGMDRGTVADQVLTSPEAEQRLVDGYYQQILERPADKTGQSTCVADLAQGQRDETVQSDLLASDEYFQNL